MLKNFLAQYRPLSHQERLSFYERLALYVRSGIPIVRSLVFIRDTAKSEAMPLFTSILENTLQGQSLAKTLSQYPRSFPPFDTYLIELSEHAGTLAETLERLVQRIQSKRELRRVVLSALMYPILIAFGTVLISAFLLIFTLPKILPLFKSMDIPLPLTTRLLIAVSDFLASSWLVLLLTGVVLVLLSLWASRFEKVNALVSHLVLMVPILGSLLRSYHSASNLNTLAMLLRSGIPIVPALGFCKKAARSYPYRDAIARTESSVRDGHPLSQGLSRYEHLFPRAALQLIAAGEETGTLPTSIQTASILFERECRERCRALTTLIEPVLMIGMGAIVGFIALAIISPIYGITQNLHSIAP